MVVIVTCSTPGKAFKEAIKSTAPFPYQGLSSGNLKAGNAAGYCGLCHLQKLLISQQTIHGKRILQPIGHTILAMQITAVRNGHSHIIDFSLEPILHLLLSRQFGTICLASNKSTQCLAATFSMNIGSYNRFRYSNISPKGSPGFRRKPFPLPRRRHPSNPRDTAGPPVHFPEKAPGFSESPPPLHSLLLWCR